MNLYIDLVGKDKITLKFKIINTPIADLWLERMNARGSYPLDHPRRFYGFNNHNSEIQRAENYIRDQIVIINNYRPIIEREFTHHQDQDCLNYLHNIFERFHGLLNQQDQEFWSRAPDQVKQALSELNLAVHRCETVARGALPRFTCTWYGMPKTLHLPQQYMLQYGTLYNTFGTVYLNYCEIGKSLEDLAMDRDSYISDDAFRPHDFYSADFVVKFWNDTEQKVSEEVASMREYYNQHQEFFVKHGYPVFDDPRLLPLRFPVAQIDWSGSDQELLYEIQQRQYVEKVYIQ